jgi:putative hydrolase of the HAD superfamily
VGVPRARTGDATAVAVSPRIQAVTFDVGGTLIEPWPSVGHIYAEVATRFDVRAEPEALNAGFRAAWKAKRDFDYSRAAWFDLVRATFGAGQELPPEFFPAVYERFAEPDAWRIFDDVLPTLDALATQGIRLAAISNWDERLEPLLRRLDLHRWFEAVVVSCDVRFTKPSSAIFAHALRKLALPAEAVIHVGDGVAEDFEGAHAAGLGAVLVRRDGGGEDAARAIRSLRELPSWLSDA